MRISPMPIVFAACCTIESAKPDMSSMGMSGLISRIAETSSVPDMPGIAQSVMINSKSRGARLNLARASSDCSQRVTA